MYIVYLFLGKGSFASTYKAIYELKNVCVKKKTAPNVRQRACYYFFQRSRNYTKNQ